MALSNSVKLTHAQRAVPCNVCEDEVPGEYYCIECKQTLCPQCEKNHKRVAATKNHNIVLRTQVGDIDTTTLTCTDHGDQASCHCEKCNVPVCIKCVTGRHQGHKMIDLNERLEMEKKLLQDHIDRIKKESLSCLKERKKEVETKKENNQKKFKQITKAIEAESELVQNELARVKNERLRNLASVHHSQSETFDGISKDINIMIKAYEKTILEYEDAIRENHLPTLINLTKEKQSLPEAGGKQELPEPPVFVPGEFHPILAHLENLSFKKPLQLTTPTIVSKFKNPLKGFPRICTSKGGQIWLGGSESKKLIMVDMKGQVLGERNIQIRPKALAMLDNGDVVISPHCDDSSSVRILLCDGIHHDLFDASPSFNDRISVTINQQILICTLDGRVVRTDRYGRIVKQIYTGIGINSAVHAVEKSDGNIYIADNKNSAVVIVDEKGHISSTIPQTTGRQKLVGLVGFAIDYMGNILCADRNNHCVYIMDQQHTMRELVGRSHGLKEPNRLVFDSHNNLWITETGGKIYIVKYLI